MKASSGKLIENRIEPTPTSFHTATEASLAALPDKRRRRAFPILRVALAALVLLALLCVPASGAQPLGVNWFLQNRRVESVEPATTDLWSVSSIAYDGLFLAAELNDAVWDRNLLSLSISYSLGGTSPDALSINRDQLGMDGTRHDHIWTKDGIFPVDQWRNGQRVIVYSLDGWKAGSFSTRGSYDWLPDGLGETLLSELDLSYFNPERYASLLDDEGLLTLTQVVHISDYDSNELLETGVLTVQLSAPSVGEWRFAYESIMP